MHIKKTAPAIVKEYLKSLKKEKHTKGVARLSVKQA